MGRFSTKEKMPKASTDLAFTEPEAAETLIKRVRSDADDLAWVIFKYEANSDNMLGIHASGEGNLEEFRSNFDVSQRMYGLLRLVDVYDGHRTIKFVFIPWAGERVGIMRKARMTTHKGSITELIGQAHVTIDCSEPGDMSDDIVMTRITDASGSGNRVLSAVHRDGEAPPPRAEAPKVNAPSAEVPKSEPAPVASKPAPVVNKPTSSSVSSKGPSVPRGNSSELSFGNVEEGQHAIKRVRSDEDAADWVLFGYEGNSNVVILEGVGSGGLAELKQHLADDKIFYGIVRVYDSYDGHRTTKFVLILWVGDKVKIIRKARVTTHKGAVLEFLGQYHVDIPCSEQSEITDDIVKTQVQMAAGTAIHIKDRVE